jgi:hypothetical protein
MDIDWCDNTLANGLLKDQVRKGWEQYYKI